VCAREREKDLGDARRAADQHELVHLVLLQRGVVQHLLDGPQRLLEQVHAELLELGARDRLGDVLMWGWGLEFRVQGVGFRV